jgi:hypothetical protein
MPIYKKGGVVMSRLINRIKRARSLEDLSQLIVFFEKKNIERGDSYADYLEAAIETSRQFVGVDAKKLAELIRNFNVKESRIAAIADFIEKTTITSLDQALDLQDVITNGICGCRSHNTIDMKILLTNAAEKSLPLVSPTAETSMADLAKMAKVLRWLDNDREEYFLLSEAIVNEAKRAETVAEAVNVSTALSILDHTHDVLSNILEKIGISTIADAEAILNAINCGAKKGRAIADKVVRAVVAKELEVNIFELLVAKTDCVNNVISHSAIMVPSSLSGISEAIDAMIGRMR